MNDIHKLKTTYVTPTFAHAVETFLVAHTAASAWSPGTTVKYRQTRTALAAWLAGTPVGDDVAVLDTDPGVVALLAQAYTAAFGTIAPTTRVRHLSTLRSALAGWRDSAGWIVGDPTAGWVRPKVTVDTTRALTRDQVAALWRLDVTLHQLRHAMLTHEANNGTDTATLLARSRHASVRSLEHYARPGPQAVTAHVAATDPATRRRSGQGR